VTIRIEFPFPSSFEWSVFFFFPSSGFMGRGWVYRSFFFPFVYFLLFCRRAEVLKNLSELRRELWPW